MQSLWSPKQLWEVKAILRFSFSSNEWDIRPMGFLPAVCILRQVHRLVYREPGCRGSNVVQILYCCTWINVSAISTWLEYFFFRRLFTFTPYTCVQKLCTPVVGKTFLLLLGLKNTNSVQSNLICIHCSCLEVELFEFCCCVVPYMDVDRILEYLGFGGNVQYVFSTWKNKHVENTIGYW